MSGSDGRRWGLLLSRGAVAELSAAVLTATAPPPLSCLLRPAGCFRAGSVTSRPGFTMDSKLLVKILLPG
jgi:hypothetical protein